GYVPCAGDMTGTLRRLAQARRREDLAREFVGAADVNQVYVPAFQGLLHVATVSTHRFVRRGDRVLADRIGVGRLGGQRPGFRLPLFFPAVQQAHVAV